MDTLLRASASKQLKRGPVDSVIQHRGLAIGLMWHSALATISDAERMLLLQCHAPLPPRSAESPVETTLTTKQYRSVGYPCRTVHVHQSGLP